MLLFPLSNDTHVLNRYLASSVDGCLMHPIWETTDAAATPPRSRSSQSECTPQSHYKIYCFIRLRLNRITGGESRGKRTDCISVVCLPFVVAVLLLFLLSPFQTVRVRWSPTTAKEVSGFVGRVLVPPSLHKHSVLLARRSSASRLHAHALMKITATSTSKGRKRRGWVGNELRWPHFHPEYHFSLRLFQVCQLACPT